MFIITLLPTIAGLVALCHALSFLKLLYRNFLSPLLYSKRRCVKKIGNWVIITGSTDGIGKAFAELLAQDGYNLVLISRSDEKLEKVRMEILEKSNVEIRLIKADFSKIDVYDNIERNIRDLAVGMLINNVGMSYPYPSNLQDDVISNEFSANLVHCNCLSVVLMTRLVLKAGMLLRGGFIVNISSALGMLPGPLLAIYGSSKSFVNSFSESMQSELKNSHIVVQNVEPFVVSTNMSMTKPSMLSPSAKSYANNVLNRLGTCATTHGCFVHELQGWIIRRIPRFAIERFFHSSLLKMRKRALHRLAKQQ